MFDSCTVYMSIADILSRDLGSSSWQLPSDLTTDKLFCVWFAKLDLLVPSTYSLVMLLILRQTASMCLYTTSKLSSTRSGSVGFTSNSDNVNSLP